MSKVLTQIKQITIIKIGLFVHVTYAILDEIIRHFKLMI
jgi:hypothetical protein